MSDPFLGKQLGDYVIQELLGRGGMARVYKGYDERLQRFAAVKVINSELAATADQAEYAERFRREARAIARLHHPNIVGVYQFGEYEASYYMAMVFIEGKDLREILKEKAENGTYMAQADVLNIVRGIGGGLDYAHTRGVIHRDIKPSNIMLDSENRAVLTDFGLALNTTEGTLGDTFGSAHYIAPEQAVSSAKAVPQSDLYSLGVVMYEMLAGKVPFDDPSAMSVALKHLNDAPPPPTLFNPAITPPIEKVLLKILDKDPNQRYATGEQLGNALEAAISGKYEAPIPISKAPAAAAMPIDARQVAAQAHESRLAELKNASKTGTPAQPVTAAPAQPVDKSKMTPVRTPSNEDAISTMLPTPAPAVDLDRATQELKPLDPNARAGKPNRSPLPFVLAAVVILLLLAAGVFLLSRGNPPTQAANNSTGTASAGQSTAGAGASGTQTAIAAIPLISTAPSTESAAPSVAPTTTPSQASGTNSASSTSGAATTGAEDTATPTGISTNQAAPGDTSTAQPTQTLAGGAVTANSSGSGASTPAATTVATTTATTVGTVAATPSGTLSGTTSAVVPAGASGTPGNAMLTLTYDDTQFIIYNSSGKILDIHKLVFVQKSSDPGATRQMDMSLFYASSAQYSPYSLPARFCYQVYRNDQAQPTPIPECSILPINFRAAWAKVADGKRFWIPASSSATTFEVDWDTTVIATCTISAGRCDVNVPNS